MIDIFDFQGDQIILMDRVGGQSLASAEGGVTLLHSSFCNTSHFKISSKKCLDLFTLTV